MLFGYRQYQGKLLTDNEKNALKFRLDLFIWWKVRIELVISMMLSLLPPIQTLIPHLKSQCLASCSSQPMLLLPILWLGCVSVLLGLYHCHTCQGCYACVHSGGIQWWIWTPYWNIHPEAAINFTARKTDVWVSLSISPWFPVVCA